jgi:hypothetical protein
MVQYSGHITHHTLNNGPVRHNQNYSYTWEKLWDHEQCEAAEIKTTPECKMFMEIMLKLTSQKIITILRRLM